MLLTPLGCQAGMPVNGEASSGYLVRHNDLTLMLDAGPGTAVRLSTTLAANPLSGVFISHQHSDHIYDLLPIGKMLLSSRIAVNELTGTMQFDDSLPRVPLFVPQGAKRALSQLAALFPVTTHPVLDRAFELAFDLHEYEPGETHQLGDLSLRFELLNHVSPNCGIRIDSADRSLVYTGDTGVTDMLPELASGAGTLLSESTLRSTDETGHGHLSSEEAGRAAHDAGVAELILTHFSTTNPVDHAWHRQAAETVYSGRVSVASPGSTVTIAPTTRTSPLRKETA